MGILPKLRLLTLDHQCHPLTLFTPRKKITLPLITLKRRGLLNKSYLVPSFRKMLRAGDDIPTWFAFESVVKVLREEAARDEKFADRKAAVKAFWSILGLKI